MWTRWERYWFAAGGRLSLAILRIAIALSILHSLDTMAGRWVDVPAYRPVGLWMLAGSSAPSPAVVDVVWMVARIATIAMCLGLFSRAATALSFIASSLIASLSYSGFPTWSHQYNVILLAQLAIVGSRCGDALSIDALIFRRRPPSPHGYQWAIRLAQIAIALMFASGSFHKVWHGGPTLDWALSDNLRNQLVTHFDAMGHERTPLAHWIIDDVWKFRFAALINLSAQVVPLVGCLLVRRPLLRALCGGVFVLETLGLGLVMDLWNWQWLPLAVVFIDWEWLLQRREERAEVRPPRRSRIAVLVFVGAFLALDLLTSFVPRLDRRLNLYPFTAFPMFASIRAAKPYDRHAPYSFEGGHIEIIAPAYVPPEIELELDRYYAKLFRTRNREPLHVGMQGILGSARRMFPATTGVRVYYVIFEVPAYPAPARVDRRPVALLGELMNDGTFRSQLGASGGMQMQTPGKPIYVVDEGDLRWVVRQ